MKHLITALLLFISSTVSAMTYELSVKHIHVHQNLFGTINFHMDGLGVSAGAWHDSGFGVTLEGAKSTESSNSLYVLDKFYTNEIKSLFTTAAWYRHEFNPRWSAQAGLGYTDYKTKWWVNDEDPLWGDGGKDTDSDISKHIQINYRYHDNFAMFAGYSWLYDKNKPNFGVEDTEAWQFGFTYLF